MTELNIIKVHLLVTPVELVIKITNHPSHMEKLSLFQHIDEIKTTC